MSFLLPVLSTLGNALLPKALNWVGKKLNGSAIGQVASHIGKNQQYLDAANKIRDGMLNSLMQRIQKSKWDEQPQYPSLQNNQPQYQQQVQIVRKVPKKRQIAKMNKVKTNKRSGKRY